MKSDPIYKSDYTYKVIDIAKNIDVESELDRINMSGHYTEDIRQYNGTNDPVVVTSEHPAELLMRYHDHNFYEINYVVRGTCTNMIEGQCLNMKTGDFVLLHPETLHTLYVSKGSYVCNFLIDIAWLGKLFKKLINAYDKSESPALDFARYSCSPNAYKFIFFYRDAHCSSLAHNLINSFDMPFRSVLREALMTQFLLSAFTSRQQSLLSESRGISNNAFKKIYNFTMQNYAFVTQELLEKTFHYSRSYICKLFKCHTGKSFSHNLIIIRLYQAQALLVSTNLPVEKIALSVGYTSVEYFHRLYRQTFGITPGEYRAMKKK